jgi:hypothetical protein
VFDAGELYPIQVGGLALFILRPTAPSCLLGSKLFNVVTTTNRPMVCFHLHVSQEGVGYALEFTNEGG